MLEFLNILMSGKSDPFLREFDNSIKGMIGEASVSAYLKLALGKGSGARLYNDMTLALGHSYTTQIDHILVCKKGIFVIETKNIKGWVFGNSHAKNWTISLPNRRKIPFRNPLHQNHKHLKAISTLLPQHLHQHLVSVVAFTHYECEIKTSLPSNVLKAPRLPHFIQTYPDQLSLDVIAEIKAILDAQLPHQQANQEQHQRNIRRWKGI